MSHDTEASFCLAYTHFSPKTALVPHTHTPSIRESGAKHKRVHNHFPFVDISMDACLCCASYKYLRLSVAFISLSCFSKWLRSASRILFSFRFFSSFARHARCVPFAHTLYTHTHTYTIARLFSPLVGRISHRSVFGESVFATPPFISFCVFEILLTRACDTYTWICASAAAAARRSHTIDNGAASNVVFFAFLCVVFSLSFFDSRSRLFFIQLFNGYVFIYKNQ